MRSIMHKCNRNIDDIKRDIRTYFERRKGDKQLQTKLAEELGVNQGTISRYKNGRFSRISTVEKLCKYAGIPTQENNVPDEKWSNKLTSAVLDVWDGSIKHARKLEKIIRVVGNETRHA